MGRPVERQLFCLPLWGDLHLHSFSIKVVIVSSDLWKLQRTLGGFLLLTGSPAHTNRKCRDAPWEYTPFAILFLILHRGSTDSSFFSLLLLPRSQENRDGKREEEEEGKGRRGELKSSRNKERHPFAHQFFFLLSEPRKRERPPLSLCDRNASPPPPPPSNEKTAWMESHIQNRWMGRGGNW